MAWFKIDDAWWAHPKIVALGDGAAALWVRAGTWSAQQLTDGHIPNHILPILRAKPAHVRELVTASLWIPTPDGHRFHDWSHYQPSREQVLEERQRNAERQRKFREKKKPTTTPP